MLILYIKSTHVNLFNQRVCKKWHGFRTKTSGEVFVYRKLSYGTRRGCMVKHQLRFLPPPSLNHSFYIPFFTSLNQNASLKAAFSNATLAKICCRIRKSAQRFHTDDDICFRLMPTFSVICKTCCIILNCCLFLFYGVNSRKGFHKLRRDILQINL